MYKVAATGRGPRNERENSIGPISLSREGDREKWGSHYSGKLS